MPELPEVQTIVDDLNKKVAGRRIIDVWSDWKKTVKKPSFDKFKKLIKGKKILKVLRQAKNILIYLSENHILLIHLKMTGHLLVGKWRIEKSKVRSLCQKDLVIPIEPKEVVEDPYNKYIHLIFYLDNGQMLGFSDLRKFGKMILGTQEQIYNLAEIKKLGPEPLDPSFKVDKFVSLISSKKGKIKQILIDPAVIAGIGNIYSDEILWLAEINPFSPADKLTDKELKSLWRAMHVILKKALKLRGTSVSDYRDTAGKKGKYAEELLVYQREGEKCLRCGALIKRIKIGGRSAHYCPKCQKL